MWTMAWQNVRDESSSAHLMREMRAQVPPDVGQSRETCQRSTQTLKLAQLKVWLGRPQISVSYTSPLVCER